MRRQLKELTYKNAEHFLYEYIRVKSKISTLPAKMRIDLVVMVENSIKSGTYIRKINNEIGIFKDGVFYPKIKLSLKE